MKKSSITTANKRANKLLDDTCENVRTSLVGKIVRSKQDPFKEFISDKSDEEKVVGMIVKVEKKVADRRGNLDNIFRQRVVEHVWTFHILIDENVEVIAYGGLSKFVDHWDILEP